MPRHQAGRIPLVGGAVDILGGVIGRGHSRVMRHII